MYKIDEIHYRDIFGKLMWKEEMIFSRLHAIDEELVENGETFIVKRIAVADNIQHVNILFHRSCIMADYIVSIDNSPHIKVEAINLFLAAVGAVRQSGARDIKTIVVRPHGVRIGPTTFDSSNIQILADKLFRLSPLAEGFEVEETNREGDVFYYIDPESNVIELTLDGRVVWQTEE